MFFLPLHPKINNKKQITQEKMEKNVSLRQTLKEMEVGESAEFPISKVSTMRAIASTMGLELERKYSSRCDKERRIITVTRIE